MSKKDWRGIFAIPMTPFDAADRIDEDVLAAEIDFCIASQVGGIISPVMVSEFWYLSEEERRTMMRVPVEVCRGTGVPVVGNVTALSTPQAVAFAEYAQQIGVDAVSAMPPYLHKPDFDTIFRYFQAISDAVEVPVFIQNAGMAALSPDEIVRLCSEIEHVSWVKEEVPPGTKSIARLAAKQSPAIEGIFGGGGGRMMITERDRGAVGNMPACEFCDVLQRVWDLLDAGETAAAEDLFDAILPGIVLEGHMGMAFAKEIMVRRGVFTNTRMRNASKPLDEADLREIDRVYARIEPYFIWHK
jgi:dihydrodipicolinate synthase/N-acetylneuraminate lyase